ncbi:MAG: thioredoxin domain-containing protein, partial [Terriglobales bacterium]
MSNRLAKETSPYLRQHAENPVDWYPWGEEAFARARQEDKPVLLSIGYAACHWCHVMEHESFENAAVAEALNRDFVAIKVDREERPDVDRIYMSYVQAISGSGGWPLSVFLTPELQPFFGATYFPAAQFLRVLASVAGAWQQDRTRVLESSRNVGRELARILMPPEPASAPARELMEEVWPALFERYREHFDAVHGGFGGAPKFPHPVALEFLLRYERRHKTQAREMLAATLRAMATGGLHDLIGGGFHRYCVDAAWRVPHFEKMLYDQAQLALVYLGAWQLLRDDRHAATVRSTLDFVLKEMSAPEGGFFAAQDADSPLPEDPTRSREGAYYLWATNELEPEAGMQAGEFEGKNILYGSRSDVAQATLDALYARRRRRPPPPTDAKVLT